MPEPKISVIVPVYKVEKYLRKCVDSILNQTYRNLEIILVDDGSPDGCPAICDEYAAADGRVKVIHKPNGGVSSARNMGLDMAAGDYFGFVDSDDWIDPGMFESLLNALRRSSASIAACGYTYYTDAQNVRQMPLLWDNNSIDGENLVGSILYGATPRKRVDIGPFVWNKLFKRELWENTRFDTSLVISEDLMALLQIVLKSETMAVCPQPLYFYRQNKSGVIGSTGYLEQSRMGCELLQHIVAWFDQEDRYVDLALENLTASYFIYLNYLAVFHDRKRYYAVRKEFKQYWNRIMPRRRSYNRNYRLALLLLKVLPEPYWYFSIYHNRKVKYRI